MESISTGQWILHFLDILSLFCHEKSLKTMGFPALFSEKSRKTSQNLLGRGFLIPS